MELRDFPLAWRWTDERFTLLPNQVLARIIPQSTDSAARLWAALVKMSVDSGLDDRKFEISWLGTGNVNPAAVTAWLLARYPDRETAVLLSWTPNWAVETSWGIFTDYWSEFCYPSSDDVQVRSVAHGWVLHYHHHEMFEFGEPR
jgi:hypothetical protein